MSIPTSGELRIIIEMSGEGGKQTANGNAPSETNPETKKGVEKNPKDGSADKWGAMAMHTVINVGQQAVNTGVSTIGLATGNYYAQAKAQQAMQGLSSAAGFATTLASGNVFAIATVLAGTAISTVSELYTQKREREIANYEAEQYAKRLGFTVGRR